MDNFKEHFYKILINREGFFIKQYYSNFHKKEVYLALKELKDGIYCVLISQEENEEKDILEAAEYIKSLKKPFSLNIIILSNSEYKYVNNSSLANRLIINKENNNVIKCDNSCMPLKYIYENIMREKTENRKEKYKFFKYKIPTLVIITINIIMYITTQIVINNITNTQVNNMMGALQAYSQEDRNKIINQLVNNISNSVLISFGAKDNVLINSGQIWRLLTCAFLHFNLIHIASNMYSLYIIGPQIEQIYGEKKYLGIYFFSCITASLLSYFMSTDSISAGASGGIFGLMGALLVFAIIERNKINKRYLSSILKVIIINLFIGLSINNIDNFAHVGGLIGGVFIGYISYNYKIKRHNNR